MKRFKPNILNIIQYIIIILFILLIVYYSYQKFILKNKSVSFFNCNFFVILSSSMEPTIKTKDLVVTHPKSTYEVNDIIAFDEHGSTVVHRITNIEYTSNGTALFTTKGDNNNTIDADTITLDEIIGAYLFTIPFLGSLIIFLSNNPIFFFIILAIIILIYFIIKLIKKLIKK